MSCSNLRADAAAADQVLQDSLSHREAAMAAAVEADAAAAAAQESADAAKAVAEQRAADAEAANVQVVKDAEASNQAYQRYVACVVGS